MGYPYQIKQSGHGVALCALIVFGAHLTRSHDHPARSDDNAPMRQLRAARSGKVQHAIVGRGEPVTALACTGNIIASGHADQSVRLWDVRTGKVFHTYFMNYEYDWRAATIAISRNGKTVAASPGGTAAPGDVWLWDTRTGKHLWTLKGRLNKDDQVHSLAFAPDGLTLISGGHDGTVRVWEVRTGRLHRMIYAQQGSVISVACAPRGNIVASGGDNFTPRLWDGQSGTLLRNLPGHSFSGTYAVAFSPDGKILVTAGDRLETKNRTLDVPRGRTFTVGEIRLWDTRTNKLLRTLIGPAGPIYSLAFAPDGKTLAGGSNDTTRLWDVATGRVQATLRGTRAGALAFPLDGKKLLYTDKDGALRLWDVRQKRALLRTMVLPGALGVYS